MNRMDGRNVWRSTESTSNILSRTFHSNLYLSSFRWQCVTGTKTCFWNRKYHTDFTLLPPFTVRHHGKTKKLFPFHSCFGAFFAICLGFGLPGRGIPLVRCGIRGSGSGQKVNCSLSSGIFGIGVEMWLKGTIIIKATIVRRSFLRLSAAERKKNRWWSVKMISQNCINPTMYRFS